MQRYLLSKFSDHITQEGRDVDTFEVLHRHADITEITVSFRYISKIRNTDIQFQNP